MIIAFDGPAGSGKSREMALQLKTRWRGGENIYPNFPLWFDENHTRINRWFNLNETFHLSHGVLAIDESPKFLHARKWHLLPTAFIEKIATHRHDFLDIYTTTQHIKSIDVELRKNIHEVFSCKSIIRIPKKERVKPIFQILKIIHRRRAFSEDDLATVRFQKVKTYHRFISRLWTRTYYDTYANIEAPRFLCVVESEKQTARGRRQWVAKIYSRELVDHGKARI